MGAVRRDPEKEEAKEGQAEGAPGQELQEGAGVAGKEDCAEGGEEECTETKGGDGNGGRSAPVIGPVEGRCFDGGSKGHAASETREVGEETQGGDGARGAVVGLVQGKVAGAEQNGAQEDKGPGPTAINQDAHGDAE